MNEMFEQFQLNKEQMNQIEGGVSKEEYCATLRMIAENSSLSEGAQLGLNYGWSKYCQD